MLELAKGGQVFLDTNVLAEKPKLGKHGPQAIANLRLSIADFV